MNLGEPITVEKHFTQATDGIFGRVSVSTKRDVCSGMLTTNVSANGTFSAAVGTMMGQHQDDKQSCEDVMAKYMAMSDTELSYEISRAEAAHSELLHTVADMISGLSKSGTTLSMLEKVSQIRSYKLPTVGLTGWVDSIQRFTSFGERPLDVVIENNCFKFSIFVQQKSTTHRNGKSDFAWEVDYVLSQNQTTFDVSWSKNAGKYELLDSLKKPARFDKKEDALTYAKRKMDAIEKELFQTETPAIPSKYAEHFRVFGIPLPGYTFL